MSLPTSLNQTFTSFTGADIQAVVTYNAPTQTGPPSVIQKLIGTLSSITISVVREVNPLWSMGSPDFRSVARGKRSVSGTLSFMVYDRDPLVRDLFNMTSYANSSTTSAASTAAQAVTADANSMPGGLGNVGGGASYTSATNVINLISGAKKRYADQLPPFDVTISMTNEVGASSVAAVRQIYVVSQGSGWSTHDLESDQVYSYIARYYEPLTSLLDTVQNQQSGNSASGSSLPV